VDATAAAGKDRAALGAGLIADGDNVIELLSTLDHLGNGLGLRVCEIDAFLGHRFDDERVERPGFEPGALRFVLVAAISVHEGLGHL
jgi:hypothetical protein